MLAVARGCVLVGGFKPLARNNFAEQIIFDTGLLLKPAGGACFEIIWRNFQ